MSEEGNDLQNPKCHNCGGEEFVYRRIPEEKKREIDFEPRKEVRKRRPRGIFHVAVIYCVNCGEVIGTAGGFNG